MSRISKYEGQIVLGPPTISPKSDEAKRVKPGEKLHNIQPKKIGDILFKDKKFWRIISVHPIEYRSKYGKEWSPAHQELIQTYNVWTGDYRYTYQEIVYDPDWKFNIGELVLCKVTNKMVAILSRHGSACPWYKVITGQSSEEIVYEKGLEKIDLDRLKVELAASRNRLRQ